jgi:hypothetical protein
MRIRHLTACAALVALPVGRDRSSQEDHESAESASEAGRRSARGSRATSGSKRQAEFVNESKHDWTNDSLRTALLDAAGLKAPLKIPFQFGVRFEGSDSTPPGARRRHGRGAQEAGVDARLDVADEEVSSARRGRTPSIYSSDSTRRLAKTALHRMMEAGPAESPAADVATARGSPAPCWRDESRSTGRSSAENRRQGRAGADGRLGTRRHAARRARRFRRSSSDCVWRERKGKG